MSKALTLAALCFLATAGCATVSPRVDVLGVSPRAGSDSRMLFVEVTNPTQRPLELSRLRYNVQGPDVQAQGELRLTRNVIAGSSAIIEVPLQAIPTANPAGSIVLTGRLYARDDRIERSWKFSAKAAIPGEQSGNEPIRIRIADATLR